MPFKASFAATLSLIVLTFLDVPASAIDPTDPGPASPTSNVSLLPGSEATGAPTDTKTGLPTNARLSCDGLNLSRFYREPWSPHHDFEAQVTSQPSTTANVSTSSINLIVAATPIVVFTVTPTPKTSSSSSAKATAGSGSSSSTAVPTSGSSSLKPSLLILTLALLALFCCLEPTSALEITTPKPGTKEVDINHPLRLAWDSDSRVDADLVDIVVEFGNPNTYSYHKITIAGIETALGDYEIYWKDYGVAQAEKFATILLVDLQEEELLGFTHPFELVDGDQEDDTGCKDDDKHSIVWPTTTCNESEPGHSTASLAFCDDMRCKTNRDCSSWTWETFETAIPSFTKTLTLGINTTAISDASAPSQLTNKSKPLPSGIDSDMTTNTSTESLLLTPISASLTSLSPTSTPTSTSATSVLTGARSSSLGPTSTQTSGSAVIKQDTMQALLAVFFVLMVVFTSPASAHDTMGTTYASKVMTQTTTSTTSIEGIVGSKSSWFGDQVFNVVADVPDMIANFATGP